MVVGIRSPRWIVLFSFIFLHLSAAAGQQVKYFSLTCQYQNYTDMHAPGSAVASSKHSPAIGQEFGLRLVSHFQLIVTNYNTIDYRTSAQGVGFRIDTPGFFFLGSAATTRAQRGRKYPVNTSLFGQFLRETVKYSTGKIINNGSELGFGLDIFLFNHYAFIATKAALVTLDNNVFANTGVGLGFEF